MIDTFASVQNFYQEHMTPVVGGGGHVHGLVEKKEYDTITSASEINTDDTRQFLTVYNRDND